MDMTTTGPLSKDLVTKSFDLRDILPPSMIKSLDQVPEEWWEYNEVELREKLKPTDTAWKLRVRFWAVYSEFCDPRNKRFQNKTITGREIFDRIIDEITFWTRYANKPKNVFFITRPLEDFMAANQAALQIAAVRLQELINLDVRTKNGEDWCPKKAAFVLNAIKETANRAYGSSIERIAAIHRVEAGRGPQPEKEIAKEIGDPRTIDQRINDLLALVEGDRAKENIKVEDTNIVDAETVD